MWVFSLIAPTNHAEFSQSRGRYAEAGVQSPNIIFDPTPVPVAALWHQEIPKFRRTTLRQDGGKQRCESVHIQVCECS